MPEPLRRGDVAPPFDLPATTGRVSLASLLDGGSRAIVAFYTEDGTPSCQLEVNMLRDAYDMLAEFRARVVAISGDTLQSHGTFAERLGGLPFPLASDLDLTVASAYGVVDASQPQRAARAIFVIAPDGRIALAIPRFQPNSLAHIEEIFATLGEE